MSSITSVPLNVSKQWNPLLINIRSLNVACRLSSVSDNEIQLRTKKKCEKQPGNSKKGSKHRSNNKENGEINETRKSGRIRNNLDYFKTHNGVLLDD